MNYRNLICIVFIFSIGCAQQDASTTGDDDAVVLVEVDGQPVTLAMLERVMASRGVSEDDHEQMRELLDELIRMQVVANAARQEGLDGEPEVKAQLRLIRLQALSNAYLSRSQGAGSVSDQDVRDVYQAQLERSGDTQYRIEVIRYGDQARVLNAIERIEAGEASYETVRSEARSDDLAVEEPGWIDRSQVPEEFAAGLVRTDPGGVVPQPLESGQGWHLVRVIETRELEAPSLEDVRDGIARSLGQQRRQALIDSLYDQAEITPMLPLDQTEPEAGNPDSAQ